MIPVDEMLMEDFSLTFPDWSWDHKKPTMWPHEAWTPGLSQEERDKASAPYPYPYHLDGPKGVSLESPH